MHRCALFSKHLHCCASKHSYCWSDLVFFFLLTSPRLILWSAVSLNPDPADEFCSSRTLLRSSSLKLAWPLRVATLSLINSCLHFESASLFFPPPPPNFSNRVFFFFYVSPSLSSRVLWMFAKSACTAGCSLWILGSASCKTEASSAPHLD